MAKQHQFCHRVSRLFQPINAVPVGAHVKNKDLLSNSYKLMMDEGVIAPSQNGLFYLLPLAIKALDKLTRLVDNKMAAIGAQKISCPSLTSSDTWKKTDRLTMAGPELFVLADRHKKNFVLNPTHEESVAQLLASLPRLSYKQLPLLLYQMTNKFRDEMKPRFGLIRSKEFLMKDLYSFDVSVEAAQETYNQISQVYDDIFKVIGVEYLKVKGCSGMMGGDLSHEFHYPAAIGDDTLRLCGNCNHRWNRETNETGPCQLCSSANISETKGIEVGHMFLLGTRYSALLNANFASSSGSKQPMVMASYGLGLSRILAASLEVLSLPDQLRWPSSLVPYTVVIITPKDGSKEHKAVGSMPENIYWSLQEVPELEGNVILDDRSKLTIGWRLQASRRTGYPLAVVIGKSYPQVELHNTVTGQVTLHSSADVISTLAEITQQKRIGLVQ